MTTKSAPLVHSLSPKLPDQAARAARRHLSPTGQRRSRQELSNGTEQLTLSLTKPMTDTWSWVAAYTYTNATEVNPLTSSQAHSNWDGRAKNRRVEILIPRVE